MSYCRFTDDCDVYAYECDGGVQFWVAGDVSLDRLCNTFDEAYQYAKALCDEYRVLIPDGAIDMLRIDALDEVERTCGPNGVVGELRDENAKLRELCVDMYKSIGSMGTSFSEFVEFGHRMKKLGIRDGKSY